MESADATTINGLGLAVTLLFGVATLLLPRKHAPIPMLAIGVTVTLGQIWYVAGLHFSIMRIMVLFGMVRLVFRGELRGLKLHQIDKVLIFWVASNVFFYTLREGTTQAFINRLGFAYNALGLYFFFRFLIRDEADILRMLKVLAMITLPIAAMMLIEKSTGRNLYSYFGGVEEYTWVREGRLRCQGPFRHAILAGTFGAVMMPVFVGMWLSGRSRVSAALAAAAATAVAFLSASGGPVLSFVAAWIGLAAWKIRQNMRAVRWLVFAAAACLHLAMKAPVWYLIGRASGIVGGTGWHRSELINQFVTRWDEWWLMGTSETAHWMPYTLRLYNKADITNQFIAQGVDGGLLTMMLFIVLVAYAFGRVGKALKVKATASARPVDALWVWGLGVSLFTHVISFFGVSYFDQMIIYWFALLAMIAALPTLCTDKKENDSLLKTRPTRNAVVRRGWQNHTGQAMEVIR
ncbi:MAG: hypothetical protein WHT06_05095 [Desulfobacterales bacterium]